MDSFSQGSKNCLTGQTIPSSHGNQKGPSINYVVSKSAIFDYLLSFLLSRAYIFIMDAVTSSGILKAKQKLGVTFNFD